jgi:hypothetical protein
MSSLDPGLARRWCADQPGLVVLAGWQVLLQLEGKPWNCGRLALLRELYPDQECRWRRWRPGTRCGEWPGGFRLLTVLIKSADEELTPDRLDISMGGLF